jgi:hypothetical protein
MMGGGAAKKVSPRKAMAMGMKKGGVAVKKMMGGGAAKKAAKRMMRGGKVKK